MIKMSSRTVFRDEYASVDFLRSTGIARIGDAVTVCFVGQVLRKTEFPRAQSSKDFQKFVELPTHTIEQIDDAAKADDHRFTTDRKQAPMAKQRTAATSAS